MLFILRGIWIVARDSGLPGPGKMSGHRGLRHHSPKLQRDPVLSRQILASQQEFFIRCSADLGEQARPKHLGFPVIYNLTW
jgi:hypothetical protein